jgi:hypothetical protein
MKTIEYYGIQQQKNKTPLEMCLTKNGQQTIIGVVRNGIIQIAYSINTIIQLLK